MSSRENRHPISLKEGRILLDGVEVVDHVKCNIVFTPNVWTGKVVGDHGTNRRWNGYDITGSITEFKRTNRYAEMIKGYQSSGKTPEFVIQGVRTDPDSDYFDEVGSESVTVTGVVFTGDITLFESDADGDMVKETVNFGAKNIAF